MLRTRFVLLAALAACGPPPAVKQPSATPVPAAVTPIPRQPDTAALARDIPRLIRTSDVPGLSIAVVQNGRVIWRGAFGTVNDSANTPLDAGTIFEAASLSKPLFAYIVLRLADRGDFDLDRAHLALGRALESGGDLQSAIESYRRAQTLEADSADAQRQIQWTEDRLAARAHPVAVPQRALESYAGQYRERAITLRDGRLYYAGGANPESPLTPMAEDLVEVEADPTVRVRFVGGGVKPAAKLIAIYSDGSIDEWARS